MKFKLGDKVREVGKTEVKEVAAIIIQKDGIFCKVLSKEVDVQAKEIVNGVSFYKEEELEVAK